MRRKYARAGVLAAALLVGSRALHAQQSVSLTDTSQTTTLTANVSEQARVTVPAGASFDVTDVSVGTAASAASISIDSIVLATATKQMRVSLQANAALFTPPVADETTWAAGDVTWNAATWTNATGASGTLGNTAYTEVATCAADAASCSTTGLVFTLGAKPTVTRAGNHTLVVTWKFESIGS